MAGERLGQFLEALQAELLDFGWGAITKAFGQIDHPSALVGEFTDQSGKFRLSQIGSESGRASNLRSLRL